MATPETDHVAQQLEINVVFSPAPRQVIEQPLYLKVGSTIKDAVAKLAGLQGFEVLANLTPDALIVGVWGQTLAIGHVLTHGDRLEIYRPLRVDPKVARRLRFKGQGAKVKSAGLFATRREGAKAGY